MNAPTTQPPVERRYAQLDRRPLPDREAPKAGDQDENASQGDRNNQSAPDPNERPDDETP